MKPDELDTWVTFAAAALRTDAELPVEARVRHACAVADAMCKEATTRNTQAEEECPSCHCVVPVGRGLKVRFHLRDHFDNGCGYAIATFKRPSDKEYRNLSWGDS